MLKKRTNLLEIFWSKRTPSRTTINTLLEVVESKCFQRNSWLRPELWISKPLSKEQINQSCFVSIKKKRFWWMNQLGWYILKYGLVYFKKKTCFPVLYVHFSFLKTSKEHLFFLHLSSVNREDCSQQQESIENKNVPRESRSPNMNSIFPRCLCKLFRTSVFLVCQFASQKQKWFLYSWTSHVSSTASRTANTWHGSVDWVSIQKRLIFG